MSFPSSEHSQSLFLVATVCAGAASASGCDDGRTFADRVHDTQSEGKADGFCGYGECSSLCSRFFAGATPCAPLDPLPRAIADELTTLWGTQPTYLCGFYPPSPPAGACGPFHVGNAQYCAEDGGIAWDEEFMSALARQYGDFVPVAVFAHEWGHLNQHRQGLFTSRSVKRNELHADCQAGVFAALQERRGHLHVGDIQEVRVAICDAAHTDHGTCNERVSAFMHGYETALARPLLCGGEPLEAALEICAN